jgi:hypothetical protein
MLEGKGDGLQVREEADQTFFLGQAVLNHLIADEKSLDTGFGDVVIDPILREFASLSK